MAEMGIGGFTVKYLKAYYSEQSTKVRTKYGYSEDFRIAKGVRQGDILSPLLFTIFINDLLTNTNWDGVDAGFMEELRGLLYADDVAILAKSLPELRKAAEHITRWCQKWKMNIGPAKCAVMKIGLKTWKKPLKT